MMQSVQVIIERLKSHPEDFFGDFEKHLGRTPKFIDITEKIDDLLADKDKQYVHRLWYLEPEEKEALIAAYKEARRARFEASVFHTLLTKPEERELSMERMTPSGKRLMAGQIIKEFEEEYAKNRNPRP